MEEDGVKLEMAITGSSHVAPNSHHSEDLRTLIQQHIATCLKKPRTPLLTKRSNPFLSNEKNQK